MSALIGIEIGPSSTALCVVQPERRSGEVHFLVRHLERLPPTAGCVQLARRYSEIVERLAEKTDLSVYCFLNATQVGPPVVEAIRKLTGAWYIRAVYFNHGTQRSVDPDRIIQLGKAWLVSRLQVLLSLGRLHLPRSPEAEILSRELRDYRNDLPDDASTRSGAFRVGSQDDLLTALGLAVQEEIAPLTPEDQAAIDEGFSRAPLTEVGAILEMYRKLGL